MVIGPGVRAGDHVAVTPAWRAGVWHLTGSWSWRWDATGVEKRAARAQARRFAEVLQSAFPESGAYVNEASVDEPRWAASFWGRENYARLVAAATPVLTNIGLQRLQEGCEVSIPYLSLNFFHYCSNYLG